jgi:hypothetical protein
MSKSRTRNGGARKQRYCGECVWIWVGTRKDGKWVRDPVTELLGIHCKDGCTCVDANTLGIKGKPCDRLIVMCKKRAHGCNDCTCTFEFKAGAWAQIGEICGGVGGCACTPPGHYRKWGKVSGDDLPYTTIAVTWCH